jgi:hypothetical protein
VSALKRVDLPTFGSPTIPIVRATRAKSSLATALPKLERCP